MSSFRKNILASLIHISTSARKKTTRIKLCFYDILYFFLYLTGCFFILVFLLCVCCFGVFCFVFSSVLVDPTASVCFSVCNLYWAVNCPSNNLSDAATEGDPDYTTLYANAKSSCLMAAAQSFVLLWFTFNRHKSNRLLRQTQILPVFILNMFKSYCFS